MDALGRVFKTLRGRMSQEELGEELGKSQPQISILERNGTNQISDIEDYA